MVPALFCTKVLRENRRTLASISFTAAILLSAILMAACGTGQSPSRSVCSMATGDCDSPAGPTTLGPSRTVLPAVPPVTSPASPSPSPTPPQIVAQSPTAEVTSPPSTTAAAICPSHDDVENSIGWTSQARDIHSYWVEAETAGRVSPEVVSIAGDIPWHQQWVDQYNVILRTLFALRNLCQNSPGAQ